jgi:4-methyl-5(b-hydroxyethyl)-thiazole monophosphate biosynthesis
MKKVLLILPEGFEFFEASVFIDVIGWNQIEGDKSTQLFTCGFTKEVSSTFGQKVVPEYLVNEIDFNDFEALAIPGGWQEYGFLESTFRPEMSAMIIHFNNSGKMIASICTGAIAIAKSGVLMGKKATTHPVRQQGLVDFGAVLSKESMVIDGNVITSWNPSTAMDVAFALLRHLTNEENVINIKRLMGFDGCNPTL